VYLLTHPSHSRKVPRYRRCGLAMRKDDHAELIRARMAVFGGPSRTLLGSVGPDLWQTGPSPRPSLKRPRQGSSRVASPSHGPKGLPSPSPRDLFFLHLLHSSPSRLQGLLKSLFESSRGDAALAFLDDRATVMQQLRIARAVPGWVGWLLSGGAGRPPVK